MTSRLRSLGFFDAAAFACVAALALVIGCAGSESTVENATATPTEDAPTVEPVGPTPIFHESENPELLSAWGQLHVTDDELAANPAVTPYDLNSALFSDHSQKLRTVWHSDDAAPAAYEPEDTLAFPVGTVITKTFYYSLPDGQAAGTVAAAPTSTDILDGRIDLATHRLIETRILVHRDDGWHALPYVWNEEQTEASLQRTGDLLRLTLVNGDEGLTEFVYQVPNVNQCAQCHATDHTRGVINPIGPKVRHLNRAVDYGAGDVDQLTAWRTRGLLASGPDAVDAPRAAMWNDPTQSLDARARAYLDINCAHCHNSVGPADTSGLFLEPSTELGPHLGICKPPVAAGTGTGDRRYGITPGQADDSIFVFRMETTDPASMMPELGRSLADEAGIELIAEWITSLAGSCS